MQELPGVRQREWQSKFSAQNYADTAWFCLDSNIVILAPSLMPHVFRLLLRLALAFDLKN